MSVSAWHNAFRATHGSPYLRPGRADTVATAARHRGRRPRPRPRRTAQRVRHLRRPARRCGPGGRIGPGSSRPAPAPAGVVALHAGSMATGQPVGLRDRGVRQHQQSPRVGAQHSAASVPVCSVSQAAQRAGIPCGTSSSADRIRLAGADPGGTEAIGALGRQHLGSRSGAQSTVTREADVMPARRATQPAPGRRPGQSPDGAEFSANTSSGGAADESVSLWESSTRRASDILQRRP